ncbi:MAG: high-potential iron-sulfur protein [Bdellovibrionales bacterium]|nr:high-potential iron-sulfur protein [Bdellovibrionales bacterium]
MNVSRREFFKRSILSAVSVPALALLMKPRVAWASPDSPVPAGDPTATALGYVNDAASSAERSARGAEGAKQHCENCILFATAPHKIDGHEGMWGKCNVIQSGLVNAKGWCKSWALKPGM